MSLSLNDKIYELRGRLTPEETMKLDHEPSLPPELQKALGEFGLTQADVLQELDLEPVTVAPDRQ